MEGECTYVEVSEDGCGNERGRSVREECEEGKNNELK